MSGIGSFINGVAGLIGAGHANAAPLAPRLDAGTLRDSPFATFAMYRALASSNPYKELVAALPDFDLAGASLQGLRNPANAVPAMYESLLWPGTIREDDAQSALPLTLAETITNEDALRAAVHQVWRWSNFGSRKDLMVYDGALLGEQLLKVVGDADRGRVYFQIIQPEWISDLETDGRGYLTYIRIDVPQVERDEAGKASTFWHTEVWNKGGLYRRWKHQRGRSDGTDLLGAPVEALDVEQVYGADFLPFRHVKHRESSASNRGVSSLDAGLGKIIFLDALATALHERLTNHNLPDKVLYAPSGINPDTGMPLMPPRLSDSSEIEIAGSRYWALPGGWDLKDTVAQLDYANHLAAVNAHYEALCDTDLPELNWYRVARSGNDESGDALQVKQQPALSKVERARGRYEAELIAITQMCLTVAQNLRIPGYDAQDIGTYDKGAFDFWIAERPIVPVTQAETDAHETAVANRLVARTNSGMALEMALRAEGLTEDEARELARADVVDAVFE